MTIPDLPKTVSTDLVDKLPDTDIRGGLEELSSTDPAIWCAYKRRLKGTPLLFDNARRCNEAALQALIPTMSPERFILERKARLLRHRPFLLQPLRDQHPHKVYEKARQVGVSELSLTEVIWFLNYNEAKFVYTFPREAQLLTFNTTRITEAFNESPQMRKLIGQPFGALTKQIGKGYMILRSAWESNLGEGIDADGVVFDEKDRMKEGIDVAFKESLSSSKFGLIREVSTPTLPQRGVDKSFQVSDQHFWFVRCTKCGLKQEIRWPDNLLQLKDIPLGAKELEPDTYRYACKKASCRGDLDRLQGEWVAKFPERRSVRGYHISQLMAPWFTATDVMEKKIKHRFFQLWCNYVLGLPAQGETELVTDKNFEEATVYLLDSLYTQKTADWRNISVGIDWGHFNWVVILGQNVHNNECYIIGIKHFEDNSSKPLESVYEVDDYMDPFDPDITIADAGYGKDRNAFLLDKYGEEKFFACSYDSNSKGSRIFTPVWQKDKLTVSRTIMLKTLCRDIARKKIGFPSTDNEGYVELLKTHLKALAPLLHQEGEEENSEILEEITSKGPDHLAHALLYAYIGYDRLAKTGTFQFDFT